MSEYRSKADVLDALCASCYIPGVTGPLWPKMEYRGTKRFTDGGLTRNWPSLPAAGREDGPGPSETLHISPFAGGFAVCPEPQGRGFELKGWADEVVYASAQNGKAAIRAIIPPSDSVMDAVGQAGYTDTLRFLDRRLGALPPEQL